MSGRNITWRKLLSQDAYAALTRVYTSIHRTTHKLVATSLMFQIQTYEASTRVTKPLVNLIYHQSKQYTLETFDRQSQRKSQLKKEKHTTHLAAAEQVMSKLTQTQQRSVKMASEKGASIVGSWSESHCHSLPILSVSIQRRRKHPFLWAEALLSPLYKRCTCSACSGTC